MGMRFKQSKSSNLPLSRLIQGGFSTNCTSTTGVSEKKMWGGKTIKTFNLSMMDNDIRLLTSFAISHQPLYHVTARLSVQ